jgi:hypothetical protein
MFYGFDIQLGHITTLTHDQCLSEHGNPPLMLIDEVDLAGARRVFAADESLGKVGPLILD